MGGGIFALWWECRFANIDMSFYFNWFGLIVHFIQSLRFLSFQHINIFFFNTPSVTQLNSILPLLLSILHRRQHGTLTPTLSSLDRTWLQPRETNSGPRGQACRPGWIRQEGERSRDPGPYCPLCRNRSLSSKEDGIARWLAQLVNAWGE